MRVVIVTGGRTYGAVSRFFPATDELIAIRNKELARRKHVFAALDELHASEAIDLLIQGGAKGADTVAKEWAIERAVHVLTMPANWERDGKAAGPIRNGQMVKKGVEYNALGRSVLVLAFPGGRGTANMIEQSHKAGLLIRHEPKAA